MSPSQIFLRYNRATMALFGSVRSIGVNCPKPTDRGNLYCHLKIVSGIPEKCLAKQLECLNGRFAVL